MTTGAQSAGKRHGPSGQFLPPNLQQLAGMESLPETTETSKIERDGIEIQKVTICDVSFEEKEKMEEKAEVLTGITDRIFTSNGQRRYAMVVKRQNEGVTLTEENGNDEYKQEDGLAEPPS